ncbi:MAG: AAA family ATPase [Phycisphaerae bacterium]|nr:AAA family ATPase [Phycisphaerae bacterium]
MVVEDQAGRLRRLMQEAHRTRTIAVTSGKGGVGKSNVALNLSILLSAAGNRVALVDADLGLANIDVLVDVEVRGNLSHVLAGLKSLEEIIVELPSGVQLVPGANGLARLARLSDFQRAHLMRELTALEADNDIIVIDTAAGIGPDVVALAAAADTVLVVTSPEPPALTDSYAVVKILARAGHAGQISLLVNMATGRQEARATYGRLAGVARQFLGRAVYDAGYVLADPKVGEAVRKRQPVVLAYASCPASRCLAALATKLSAGGPLVGRKEGFFRAVANRFS